VAVNLTDLKPGQSAQIECINTDHPGIVRLMVLGLIEGVIVRFENAAIGGDPMEISVFGASISVRKQQAAHFQVAPVAVRG
jgi:Fe2+ transport system protein FeoA